MAMPTHADPSLRPRSLGNGFLFGIPLGDLGWFATLLMSFAAGFAAFFAATFCGIVALLVENTVLHHAVDYSVSYRLIGLPIGLLVLIVALLYLGGLWVKRILRRGERHS
jgi:hypothetical protein